MNYQHPKAAKLRKTKDVSLLLVVVWLGSFKNKTPGITTLNFAPSNWHAIFAQLTAGPITSIFQALNFREKSPMEKKHHPPRSPEVILGLPYSSAIDLWRKFQTCWDFGRKGKIPSKSIRKKRTHPFSTQPSQPTRSFLSFVTLICFVFFFWGGEVDSILVERDNFKRSALRFPISLEK